MFCCSWIEESDDCNDVAFIWMEQVHIKVILNNSQPTTVFYFYPIGEAKVIYHFSFLMWKPKKQLFLSPETYITIDQSYLSKLNYNFKKHTKTFLKSCWIYCSWKRWLSCISKGIQFSEVLGPIINGFFKNSISVSVSCKEKIISIYRRQFAAFALSHYLLLCKEKKSTYKLILNL